MIAFPLWAVFGILAAALSATQMLLQERFRTPPLAMAMWNKVACVLVMLPFVMHAGLPRNPVYYALLAAQSVLWVISDVIFYRGVMNSGAGVIARVIPFATIASFFLWFAVDPHLISVYAATPLRSLSIVAVLCLSAFFAWRLKDCAVTMKALRSVWFVIFASVAGSVSTKYITQQADVGQGVYAYVFTEALIMIGMWLVYYAVFKPLPARDMFGAASARTGLIVGALAACAVASTVYAVYHIDNPAYVSAVRYLDAVLILVVDRALGKKVQGRVWAGFGIVACAAVLVVLKAQH